MPTHLDSRTAAAARRHQRGARRPRLAAIAVAGLLAWTAQSVTWPARLDAQRAPEGRRPPAGGLQQYMFWSDAADIEFTVPFMFTTVRGRFDRARGTLLLDEARPESSSVSFVIGAASINTGIPPRDQHLRSSDFFASDSFPLITFHSERAARGGAGYVVTGPSRSAA
jgi:polyisoprenoid-binding protein YceI